VPCPSQSSWSVHPNVWGFTVFLNVSYLMRIFLCYGKFGWSVKRGFKEGGEDDGGEQAV
jgi:hypothetical protein